MKQFDVVGDCAILDKKNDALIKIVGGGHSYVEKYKYAKQIAEALNKHFTPGIEYGFER